MSEGRFQPPNERHVGFRADAKKPPQIPPSERIGAVRELQKNAPRFAHETNPLPGAIDTNPPTKETSGQFVDEIKNENIITVTEIKKEIPKPTEHAFVSLDVNDQTAILNFAESLLNNALKTRKIPVKGSDLGRLFYGLIEKIKGAVISQKENYKPGSTSESPLEILNNVTNSILEKSFPQTEKETNADIGKLIDAMNGFSGSALELSRELVQNTNNDLSEEQLVSSAERIAYDVQQAIEIFANPAITQERKMAIAKKLQKTIKITTDQLAK